MRLQRTSVCMRTSDIQTGSNDGIMTDGLDWQEGCSSGERTVTSRAFNETCAVGLKRWGAPIVHPGPASIIRVVRHVLHRRGATGVAAVRRVRPVTGGEEMHVSAASPQLPSFHR